MHFDFDLSQAHPSDFKIGVGHPWALDVVNGKAVRYVGLNLDLDLDEAMLRNRHARYFSGKCFAVRRAVLGLQHQISSAL